MHASPPFSMIIRCIYKIHQGGNIKTHGETMVANKELVIFYDWGIGRLPSNVAHDEENLNTPYRPRKLQSLYSKLHVLHVRLSGKQSEQHNFQIKLKRSFMTHGEIKLSRDTNPYSRDGETMVYNGMNLCLMQT